MTVSASGVRIGWYQLPGAVSGWVESVLGSAVVEATSQPGGFSPGTADRVVTADGRRAFVKAVSPAQNADTPALHRREIAVTGALPPGTYAPRLLGAYDDGEWVALLLEDVEGRHPATPWAAAELQAVLTATDELARRLTPPPALDVPSAARSLDEDLLGWSRIRTDPPRGLDPWAADNLDLLCELADLARRSLDGDTLAHTDVRADNVLIRPDGSVAFVDWPWACVGPAWLDALLILVNVNLHGGHDVDALLRRCRPDLDDRIATAVLAGLAGYFVDASRRPAPVGLPTVRAFQAAQGTRTLAWVQARHTVGAG